MTRIKQKLTALLMIFSFMMSMLPALASNYSSIPLNPGQTKPAPTKVQLIGDAKIKNGNKRLSVSLRDSNVKQALRMFADKAGLNIIFHDSVEDKTITLDLVGVTLNDALRMVMQASDLSYFVDGETLIIISAEQSKEMNITKQNMMTLPVRFADATNVAEFLNKNIFTVNKPGLSNTEIVAVNPSRNELLIFGTQSDYDMAKKVVEMLDEPTRITNFKVNHVTPKEMAKNICKAIVKGYSDSDNGDNNNNDNNDDDDDDDDNDNDNNSDSSSGNGNKVTLGKGSIACVSGKAGTDSDNGGGSSSGSENGPVSLKKNGMKIMYYENLGMVTVVGGSQDQLDTISAYIAATDVKQPMAYIEISIIELNEDGQKQFSTEWSVLAKNFGFSFANGITTISNGTFNTVDNVTKWNPLMWAGPYATRNAGPNPATVTQFMQYIVTNGKGKVLANPKILVTSGKESKIDLSSDYIQKMESQMVSGTSTSVSRNPSIGSDKGIIVTLTPFISRDGYVVMNLNPEYSVEAGTVIEKNQVTGNDDLIATLLSRRNLTLNNIRVKDGDTLVIGGLIYEEDSKNVKKIPLLGDIPGIGFFFRSVDNTKSKQELVLLITPHIIKDSEDLVTTGTDNNSL